MNANASTCEHMRSHHQTLWYALHNERKKWPKWHTFARVGTTDVDHLLRAILHEEGSCLQSRWVRSGETIQYLCTRTRIGYVYIEYSETNGADMASKRVTKRALLAVCAYFRFLNVVAWLGLVAAVSNKIIGHLGALGELAAIFISISNNSNHQWRNTKDLLRLMNILMVTINLTIFSSVLYISW